MSVYAINHPLVQHKLGLMREVDLSTKSFRELAGEVAKLLTYEATKGLELEDHEIQGWNGEPIATRRLKGKSDRCANFARWAWHARRRNGLDP